MSDITIRHTHAGGTLIEGSSKGDGVFEILRALRANWCYFPSIGMLGIGQSRDKPAQQWKIGQAAEALQAAGFTVTVEIDESVRRTVAEAEADRNERAEDRAAYHTDKAAGARRAADQAWKAERSILDHIPPGQPILVGHHSEGRHRRDLARADGHARRGLEAVRKGEHHDHRADAAAHYQAHRESIPVTQRRIAGLEADERCIQRELDGAASARNRVYQPEIKPAGGSYRERLLVRLQDVQEKLAYWRGKIAEAEAAGVKIWGPADFTKGDFASFGGGRWYLVERVNAKTLTVPGGTNIAHLTVVTRDNVVHAMGPSQWTSKMSYSDVRGRASAEEMAAILAEVERRKALPDNGTNLPETG